MYEKRADVQLNHCFWNCVAKIINKSIFAHDQVFGEWYIPGHEIHNQLFTGVYLYIYIYMWLKFSRQNDTLLYNIICPWSWMIILTQKINKSLFCSKIGVDPKSKYKLLLKYHLCIGCCTKARTKFFLMLMHIFRIGWTIYLAILHSVTWNGSSSNRPKFNIVSFNYQYIRLVLNIVDISYVVIYFQLHTLGLGSSLG